MKTDILVLSLFLSNPDTYMSINALATRVQKPYAHIYKYVTELVDQGILRTKTIGKSRVCMINYRSPSTVSKMAETEYVMSMSQINPELKQLQNYVVELREAGLISVFMAEGILHFIVTNNELKDRLLKYKLPFKQCEFHTYTEAFLPPKRITLYGWEYPHKILAINHEDPIR